MSNKPQFRLRWAHIIVVVIMMICFWLTFKALAANPTDPNNVPKSKRIGEFKLLPLEHRFQDWICNEPISTYYSLFDIYEQYEEELYWRLTIRYWMQTSPDTYQPAHCLGDIDVDNWSNLQDWNIYFQIHKMRRLAIDPNMNFQDAAYIINKF